jgi:hypothetical protein
VRTHWREPHYWLWLWRQRVPFAAKVTTVAVILCGLLAGGLGAADRLTSGSGSSGELVFQTTVEKLVTVREKGRIVRKLVPVALKRIQRRANQPKYVTRVVSTSGDVPAHTVAKLVPVVATRRVTIAGEPRTVVSTRLEPTTRAETATVTRTVTNTQNVTQPAATVTKTETDTVARTETRVETTTRTATQTVTETRVQTVTLPPETVTVVGTVTVTVPKPK